mmetsp:Transcript_3978/g.12542  ORF Transcript_3978/g.12542 Transcript_3978/m.12542 type:complete len:205 (+) Transcript_3978:580-1194(+)
MCFLTIRGRENRDRCSAQRYVLARGEVSVADEPQSALPRLRHQNILDLVQLRWFLRSHSLMGAELNVFDHDFGAPLLLSSLLGLAALELNAVPSNMDRLKKIGVARAVGVVAAEHRQLVVGDAVHVFYPFLPPVVAQEKFAPRVLPRHSELVRTCLANGVVRHAILHGAMFGGVHKAFRGHELFAVASRLLLDHGTFVYERKPE